jgi:hypothetical protein
VAAALLAATAPLHAQQVQMSFTGTAACGPSSGCAPWLVSFDLNTASGPQVQGLMTVAGVTYVSSFGANLDVTNFVETLGSNDVHGPASAFVASTQAGMLFNNLPLHQSPAFQINILNFLWFSDPQPSPTQARFNAPRYPLENYLLGFNGETVNSGSAALFPGLGVASERMLLGLSPVRIAVSTVPEPGILALLLPGLLGLAYSRRSRALPHRRPR